MKENFESYQIIINYFFCINQHYLELLNKLSLQSSKDLVPEIVKIRRKILSSNENITNSIPNYKLIINMQQNNFSEKLIYKHIFADVDCLLVTNKTDLYNIIEKTESNIINFIEYNFITYKYTSLTTIIKKIIFEKKCNLKHFNMIKSA